MKIERIGLSLSSIAEERRREQLETPPEHDDRDAGDGHFDTDTGEGAGAGNDAMFARLAATEPEPPDDSGVPHVDDPTARLRLEPLDADHHPTRQHAIDAYGTAASDEAPHLLDETDL